MRKHDFEKLTTQTSSRIAPLFLNAARELPIRVVLGIAIEETEKGTEGVGRRGRGSQIKSLCLSILSWLSPTQPGSIDFV